MIFLFWQQKLAMVSATAIAHFHCQHNKIIESPHSKVSYGFRHRHSPHFLEPVVSCFGFFFSDTLWAQLLSHTSCNLGLIKLDLYITIENPALFSWRRTVVFRFPNSCIWISKFYYLLKLLLGWVMTRSLSLRRFVALPKIVQDRLSTTLPPG